jgi:hypothetical protein
MGARDPGLGRQRVSGWRPDRQSAGGSSDVGGHDENGVAIEGDPRSVVAHGGAGVGVRGGILHVAQRDPAVEGSANECMAQGVRADRLGDPSPAGDTPDDPAGPVTVETLLFSGHEDRAAGPFPDPEVDSTGGTRRERNGDALAALAHDGKGPMSSLDTQGLDVGPDRFGHPQTIECQQRDQRMLGCGAETSGDEEGADLVAVQADGVGFVVDPGAADMDSRRMGD